jgi:hypothetical protein
LYTFACFALVGTMLVLAFNVFRPSILVLRSRVAAGLLLVLSLTVGVWVVDGLRTERDTAALAAEAAKAHGTWDDVQRRPETYLKVDKQFRRNGAALSISGKITNVSRYAIKNVKLKCRVTSETDVVLWKGEKTIFKSVPGKGEARFGPLSVAYLDEQAGGVGCEVVDATIAEGLPMEQSER